MTLLVRPIALSLLLLPVTASARVQAGGVVVVPQLSAPERPSASTTVTNVAPNTARVNGKRSDLATSPAQIGQETRSAEAAPALSTPQQGRTVGVARVEGLDRCEAADAAESRLCRERLEARVGDYGKPAPAPVTPEARLLILSDPPMQPQTVDDATRRLGSGSSIDSLTGGAANELAGAISGSNSASGAAAAMATPLPAGAPSTVVLSPR